MSEGVKIAFHLEKDADGYPPFDVEDLWAMPTACNSEFVIASIPFFARQATIGDVVTVRQADNRLVFEKVVSTSTNSLIRVAVYDVSNIAGIRAVLSELGCGSEAFLERSLIAVDIPASCTLGTVQRYLDSLTDQEVADYEEPILRQ